MSTMKVALVAAVFSGLGLGATQAQAQAIQGQVVSACGTPNSTPHVGQSYVITLSPVAKVCTDGTGGGGGGAVYGPTAVGGPSVNPPVQIGGVDGSGNVQAALVDGAGLVHTLSSNVFGLESTQQSVLTAVNALVTASTLSLPAGTAIIGKFGIDQTTDGTTNAVHLTAGTNIAGKFGIDQTTPGTTNAVQEIAGTAGGPSMYHVIPGASDNHVVIKNGAGQAYGLTVTSIHTNYQYVRLYDAGTGFNGCNSATNIIGGWIIPGTATGAGGTFQFQLGRPFTSGLSICVTGAFSDTDTTNATASVLSVNVSYK